MTKKSYVYNENEYGSQYAVRQALFENERIAFGEEPTGTAEEIAEFWTQYGVTYTETEETVDEVREMKLAELNEIFDEWYTSDAIVTSSLGFVADSDYRAILDVSGLVTSLEAVSENSRAVTTTTFMDATNTPQILTYEQLKTLQLEIIQNGQSAYTQKWLIRSAIESAETKEEIEAIEIGFYGEDFSDSSSDSSETPTDDSDGITQEVENIEEVETNTEETETPVENTNTEDTDSPTEETNTEDVSDENDGLIDENKE